MRYQLIVFALFTLSQAQRDPLRGVQANVLRRLNAGPKSGLTRPPGMSEQKHAELLENFHNQLAFARLQAGTVENKETELLTAEQKIDQMRQEFHRSLGHTTPRPTPKIRQHHSDFLNFIGAATRPPPLRRRAQTRPPTTRKTTRPRTTKLTPPPRPAIVPSGPAPPQQVARENAAIAQLLSNVATPPPLESLPGFKRASDLLPQFVNGVRFGESESLRQAFDAAKNLPDGWLVPYYPEAKTA